MCSVCFLTVLLSLTAAQESLNSPARIHVDQAISDLYNYRFDEALQQLDQSAVLDPEHPVTPFLRLAVIWLKTQVEFGPDSSYSVLDKSIETTIPVYEKLIEKHPENPEYRLYLASTYGMSERVALAKKHWVNIIVAGFKAHRIVLDVADKNPELKDVYMPIGIMEYYACQSPKALQWMASLLGIDPDCQAGLDHLKTAAEESYYSWIEASNILTYAYLYIEKDYDAALTWVTPLTETFPGHPFFWFLMGEALAKAGYWDELELIDAQLVRLQNTGTEMQRQECRLKYRYITALKCFERNEVNSAALHATWIIENYNMEFDWLLGFAHLLRGKCHDLRGDRAAAVKDYKVMEKLDNRYPEVEEAKQLLKQPFART